MRLYAKELAKDKGSAYARASKSRADGNPAIALRLDNARRALGMAVALLEAQIKALGPFDLALMANIAVVLEDAAVHCRLLISVS